MIPAIVVVGLLLVVWALTLRPEPSGRYDRPTRWWEWFP